MDAQIAELKNEVAELRARQARTERRSRAALAVAVVAAGAGFALGTARPVESQVTVAAKGQKVRAPFTVVDGKGKPIFQVKASGATRTAMFYDANGKVIMAVVDENGGRGMDIRDAAGAKVVGMGTLETPNGQLRGLDVYGSQDEHLLSLDVGTADVDKGFFVLDPNGTKVGTLAATPQGTGSLKLTDRNGAVVFQQP